MEGVSSGSAADVNGGDLEVGANGPAVRAVQDALDQAGFPPGPLDGFFGPATEAAVLAFQKSSGLLDDGRVGHRTAVALGVSSLCEPPDSIGIDLVCRMFPHTASPPIARNLPIILQALRQSGLQTLPLMLAGLATIRAETEGFVPIEEGRSRYNTSPAGNPFDLYDHRRDLGNEGSPDGANFKGRGFVQLTGRANYRRFGDMLGVPLLDHPEQANEPAIAARLLAAFLQAVEVPLARALCDGRLATARRLVNGGSNGESRFADAYLTGARELGLKLPDGVAA